MNLQIAQIVPATEAEGPGIRFAVWFQGCPLRCPGCCNPEFLPFRGGKSLTLTSIQGELVRALGERKIEGITLLGGEPFAHADGGLELARAARSLGLTVMIFSGYTIEVLRASTDPAVAQLLLETDILVDGPYDREQPDTERRWVGSRNQRVHFLTNRYQLDERWKRPNTLEIRVIDNAVIINGFPAKSAGGLWKGWRRREAGVIGASAANIPSTKVEPR